MDAGEKLGIIVREVWLWLRILVYCYGEKYLVRFCLWVKFRVGACL